MQNVNSPECGDFGVGLANTGDNMPRIISHSYNQQALQYVKFEQEKIKLTALRNKASQDAVQTSCPEHTPFDEIPPPNDEEMQIVQDRLNSLYNRIRAAQKSEKRDWYLSLAKDWP